MSRIVFDVGTTNTRIYIPDRDIFLCRPTLLVVDSARDPAELAHENTDQAVDEEARNRLPADRTGIRPIQHGLIADMRATQAFLQQCLRWARPHLSWFGRTTVSLSVPGCADRFELQSWREAWHGAGIKNISLVRKPLAAALAAGVAPSRTLGALLLDIGGGVTEISVIAQGRLVQYGMSPVAGEAIDRALIRHVREQYNLYLGEQTAEAVKKQIGCGYDTEPGAMVRLVGKALRDGIPRSIEVSADELAGVIRAQVQRIFLALRDEFERMSPQILADVAQQGVLLVGGGANLPGLDRMLAERAGVRASYCTEPAACVVRGSLGIGPAEAEFPPSDIVSRRWSGRTLGLRRGVAFR